MKNKIISLGIAIIVSLAAFGQSPQYINYQTIVRNADGNPVQNQSVSFRMNIYEVDINTNVETLEYQETRTVTTNEFGLVTFYIGGGTVVSGSFSGIIWGNENGKILQVELDIAGGNNYLDMGYSVLVSVPYALYAETTGDIHEIVNYAGDTKINMPFDDKSIRFISQNSEFMRMTSSGYLGIGTTTPNEMLEVNGSIRMQDGNQGTGKILVSDGLGTASWTDPSTLGDNDWTISGNDMYSDVSGNVGIGTTSPGAKLEVAGRISQTGLGNSIFIGEGAGVNDDLTNNSNVFIGYETGKTNSTGSNNIAIGFQSLKTNSTGTQNIAIGYFSLINNTSGFGNIASGSFALNSNTTGDYNYATGENTLYSNTTGSFNIATGVRALLFNTEGVHNIANGYFSLHNNTTGNDNIAFGNSSLINNITGSNNIAIAKYALVSNTTGHSNVAIGISALHKNTERSNLVAIGDSALYHNGIGASGDYAATMNTAVGSKALYSNTTGRENTANGFEALYYNTEGPLNTAIGSKALHSNTTGYYNTALGSKALYSNIDGGSNTAIGVNALNHSTSGSDNQAIGMNALNYNSTGSGNIAIGSAALYQNDEGNRNIAIGINSLRFNEGHSNVANGYQALYSNTTGSSNVAIGINALYNNTNKSNIVAIGDSALFHNGVGAPGTYAIENTAVGSKALYTNTTGYNNTATGYKTLYSNTGGWNNNAFGDIALYSNVGGSNNDAFGNGALYSNTSGTGNVAMGTSSLYNNIEGEFNTALGHLSGLNSTGSYNVFIGYRAGQNETGSNKLYISNSSVSSDYALIYGEFDNDILRFNAKLQINQSSGMVIINDDQWQHYSGMQDFGGGGEYFIMASEENKSETAGIFGDGNTVSIWSPGDSQSGQPSAYLYILDEDNFDSDGDPYNDGALKAYVNTSGNWVSVSDENKKENIKPLESSLSKLMNINTYSYSLKQSDEDKTKNTKQETTLGVLAQEVEQVLPEVIEKSDNGDYFVSYSEFIPVLIDAMKEQQETIESLQQSIIELESQVNQLKSK